MRDCLTATGCLIAIGLVLAAAAVTCGGCFVAVGKAVPTIQKSIDESYGQNSSFLANAHVRTLAERSVRSCLDHPNGATVLVGKAARLENRDVPETVCAWTCEGTLIEFGESLPKEWMVSMVLTDKAEKTWKVISMQIGDKTFTVK